MNNNITKYISPKIAASIIGVEPHTIRGWIIKDKSFPKTLKIKRFLYIPLNEYLNWLKGYKLK